MTDRTAGWELLASWPGGTVSALATAADSQETTVTLAATAAGLHTSQDGGQTWQWVALGPAPISEAVAVSPHFEADRTVLIGTNAGLHRSTDGGVSWRPVLVGSRVQCIAASPAFAAGAPVLAGTEADGILRSEDGGLGWTGANAGLLDLSVTALALSPAFERDRTAFAGTASGLYRSRNGGRAWRLVELGPEATAIQCLAVSPAFEDDGLVMAGTEADGLFRSDDGGQSWEPVRGFPEPCVTSLAYGSAGGSPTTIVAGTAAGVALSHDGGITWSLEASELGPILSLAFAGDAVLAGTIDQGIVRRTADGSAWAPANDGLAGRATVGLAVSTEFGAEALIAVASLDAGVMLSHDGGRSWKTGHLGLTDPAASSVALVRQASGQPALLAVYPDSVYQSEDIEAGWRRIGVTAPDTSARANVLGVVTTPTSGPSTVLAAGIRTLALSEDAGETWRQLPLPAPDAEIVSVAAAPDLARDRTLYAGVRATQFQPDGSPGYNGLELWCTRDLGRHWTRWLHAPDATVMPMLAPRSGDLNTSVLIGHPGRVARPMAGAEELRRGERRPILLHARIGAPLEAVTALAVSPNARRDQTVLAGASGCVYLSRDGGATIEAWDDGLHTPLVTGLTVTALPDGQLEAHALGLGGTLWRRRLT